MATAEFPAAVVQRAATAAHDRILDEEVARRAKEGARMMAKTKIRGWPWALKTLPKYSTEEEADAALTDWDENPIYWARECSLRERSIRLSEKAKDLAQLAAACSGNVRLSEDEAVFLRLQ